MTSAATQRGAATERADLLHAPLALVSHGQVVDDDIRAVPGEHARDAAADRTVARRAGDDGDLARQRRHGSTCVVASVTPPRCSTVMATPVA